MALKKTIALCAPIYGEKVLQLHTWQTYQVTPHTEDPTTFQRIRCL